MSAFAPRHIAVVGGGFSGTLAAVNLARLSRSPLRVTLINRGYPAGRGIAYSTHRAEHLLNVVARNMSALPDHPGHFVEWLRTRTEFSETPEAELRETFVPRRIYGDYLRALALHYRHPLDERARVAIESLEAEVVDLTPQPAGGARLHLADARTLEADLVLLATGNEPPAAIPGAEMLAGHVAWCANPWTDWEHRLPASTENIVLLGTGLTTVDALLTLLALGWSGPIYAVSRNGLLPESHFKGVEDPHFPPPEVDLAALGLPALLRLVEEHCARLRREGKNPGMIVDRLRPHTQRIWQAFSENERHEFVARHAARWNVVRHRIAPSIHQRVTTALESGQLRLVRASITGLTLLGPRLGVDLRAPSGETLQLPAGLVVNCTGPHTRFSATRSHLLQNLLARGLVQPDAMDMGLRVTRDFAVVPRGAPGTASLFALGPLLRGTLWESIAVPELRGQALRVAETMLDTLHLGRATSTAPLAEPVMEYWI